MPVRMLKKDEDTKREKGLKKSKMLSGGQVKLDKNKDGKISGEDFKMMGKKRGGSTPGLKNYVKKSDSEEKLIKAINKKTGQAVFVSRKQILADGDSYRPVESGIKNFVSEYARQKSKERKERLSESDVESYKQKYSKQLSDRERSMGKKITNEMIKEKIMKRKGGGSAISKLKYTAANQGGMMAKSTRGYGAARTSGMGLQDEKVKPGKVQKAALGAIALGIGLKKLMDKKGKGLPPGLGAAALISKKKKDILGKRSGGMMKYKKGGGADSGKVGEMKSKLSVGLMKANKIFGRSKPKKPKAPKQRTMTPLKKMGGGMMMKQYNKGGSVTASCKLGRNKATKLY